jgi:hypothetical protein
MKEGRKKEIIEEERRTDGRRKDEMKDGGTKEEWRKE